MVKNQGWEHTGLLQGIDDEESRQILHDNLDAAYNDVVIFFSNSYGNTSTLLFPIIRRIMNKYGFKKIRGMRKLYTDLHEQWESFLMTEEAQRIHDEKRSVEAEFIGQFIDRKGDKYF
jgi:hypothetical protein